MVPPVDDSCLSNVSIMVTIRSGSPPASPAPIMGNAIWEVGKRCANFWRMSSNAVYSKRHWD